jgi:hypothetical protein
MVIYTSSVSNLPKIRPVRAALIHEDRWREGHTYRQTDIRKLIGAFRDSANALKNKVQLNNKLRICSFLSDERRWSLMRSVAVTAVRIQDNCRLRCGAVLFGTCLFNLLKPAGHVMHQQFNIQQLYVLPTLYLCVLYLSENKQRLVPLTA